MLSDINRLFYFEHKFKKKSLSKYDSKCNSYVPNASLPFPLSFCDWHVLPPAMICNLFNSQSPCHSCFEFCQTSWCPGYHIVMLLFCYVTIIIRGSLPNPNLSSRKTENILSFYQCLHKTPNI